LIGKSVKTTKKNTKAVLVARKEVGLKTDPENNKCGEIWILCF
jgi:hypothetical protein